MLRHIHDFTAPVSDKHRIIRLRSQQIQGAVHHLPLHLQLDTPQQLLVLKSIHTANEIELRRVTLVTRNHVVHAAGSHFTPQHRHLGRGTDLLLHAVNGEQLVLLLQVQLDPKQMIIP
ncbi:hypothetical protein D3C77_459940 [compost metagenome]